MEKSRKRLTLNERIIIETLLNENKSKSYITSILEFLQKVKKKVKTYATFFNLLNSCSVSAGVL